MGKNNSSENSIDYKKPSTIHGTKKNLSRRDIIKVFASIPILGAFSFGLFKKLDFNKNRNDEILKEIGFDEKSVKVLPKTTFNKKGDLIRIGIIGFGSRATNLASALGFASPDWIAVRSEESIASWMQQDDLNVVITSICEVFDLRAELGQVYSKCESRPQNAPTFPAAKRFENYNELLASSEVDAVIIATTEFSHFHIAADAIKAGKHVYVEKCMTRTDEEAKQLLKILTDANKNSNIVFQLGHQTTQSTSFHKAKQLIEKNVIGKISLIETTTNRNTAEGSWIRHLDSNGNPLPGNEKSIDWAQWLGNSPKVPFNLERYYNWSLYWDYASGAISQLFSHDYDYVNKLLGLGIPKSCVASGGNYYWKDGREVPDVVNVVYEYPGKDLTLLYSCTLSNSYSRGRKIMGHDGFMELGGEIKVVVDDNSTRYKKYIDKGIVSSNSPLLTTSGMSSKIDAVTSASSKYYEDRGLSSTFINGKKVTPTHLHLKEWLDSIRFGTPVSGTIQSGYEESITCYMAVKSYREKRRVEWDEIKHEII